jgi:hypothetical protein
LDDGQFFQNAYNDGARIHTNSWGCSAEGDPQFCNVYNGQARDVDAFMLDHPDMLIMFAAGNEGNVGDGNTVGSPATCKNCLTVGASQNDYELSFKNVSYYVDWEELNADSAAFQAQIDNNPQDFNKDNIAFFSSVGPANRGSTRMKPDVVAPGDMIVSAHGDGDLTSNQCGSMSPSG